MDPDFKDIHYLCSGSEAQQALFRMLQQTQLLDRLRAYDPLLTGTYPLDIQVPGSDVDIICYCPDLKLIASFFESTFGTCEQFALRYPRHLATPAIVAGFRLMGYEVELFAQTIPTTAQMAYLHLLAEYKLLLGYGAGFRRAVIALKMAGLKTEPAFCRLLHIQGDPYTGLLNYRV